MLLENSTRNVGGLVISGFPGVGKSTLVGKNKDIMDSDSSKFDKKEFPNNYISHIKSALQNNKIILVSSHDVVRNALIKEKIPFILVYPDKSQKDDYIQRYKDRGSPEAFINLLGKNFDNWIDECDSIDSTFVVKIPLKEGHFLENVVDEIISAHFYYNSKSITDQKGLTRLIRIVAPMLRKFKKVATVEAKSLKAGEEVITIIDGEEETKNVAKDGDILVKGVSGEKYIVPVKTFKERYTTTDNKQITDIPTTFTKFTSTGFVYAFQWKNPKLTFVAPWGEEMICNENDFLATTSLDDIEVYRIELKTFNKSYKEV